MRTVTENRHGIDPDRNNRLPGYEHRKTSEEPSKKLDFVFVNDVKPSKFIQDLIDKFCK